MNAKRRIADDTRGRSCNGFAPSNSYYEIAAAHSVGGDSKLTNNRNAVQVYQRSNANLNNKSGGWLIMKNAQMSLQHSIALERKNRDARMK